MFATQLGEKGKVAYKTLHIATVGEEIELTTAGIRTFPAHKLVLICFAKHKEIAEKLSIDFERVLQIPVDTYLVFDEMKPHEEVLKITAEILQKDGKNFQDIVFNVGGGDKFLTCAAVASVFINGLKAFHCVGDTCVMLPVLKLSYQEIISEAKLNILRAIDKEGGEVESIKRLSQISGYGKPLLSYHIYGDEDSRGLIQLGLVDVVKLQRRKTRIRLNTLGKMLVIRR